jgi:hypothetical protein
VKCTVRDDQDFHSTLTAFKPTVAAMMAQEQYCNILYPSWRTLPPWTIQRPLLSSMILAMDRLSMVSVRARCQASGPVLQFCSLT